MKIETTDTYKSVDPFVWKNIPSLSIITGLNGAGKSQLLELIRTKPDIVQTDDGNKYKIEDITFWNSDGGGFPNNSFSFQLFTLVAITSALREHADPYNKIFENETRFQQQQQSQQNAIINSKLNFNIKGREDEIIKLIEISSGESFVNLKFEDIMYHFPEQLYLDSNNISSDRIETLFYMYHYRKSMDEKSGKDVSNYSKPPWDLLNQVFEISNLPFKVDNPSHINIDFDIKNLNLYYKVDSKYSYNLKLTHTILNKTIDFKDMSGGEKIIMSLAFLHYYAQKKNSYKKLLLLDEPDAHLHPSLTKQFLEVVDKFLIKQYGAKVIMTTHSPSTVGLCDEDSIFVMSKNPTKIEKQTRSNAIDYLTSGVPILSSIVDNRRYIFVEDKDDVTFYTKIYSLINQELSKEISLVFIPVSAERIKNSGGCTVVKTWVKKLRKDGKMNLVKGIIDRDKSNSPEDGIIVLKRYSMENYLLDPIIIAGFLIHNGLLTEIDSIAFPSKNFFTLATLSDVDLQKVVDFIIDEVETNFKTTVDKLNSIRETKNHITENTLTPDEIIKIPIEFKNKQTINYPKWLISRRGHDLEDIFRELFANNESFGIKPLLDIQERLPDFISIDLIQTYKDVL